MTVAERKEICRMLFRMERQKQFRKKLEVVNTSSFRDDIKKISTNEK